MRRKKCSYIIILLNLIFLKTGGGGGGGGGGLVVVLVASGASGLGFEPHDRRMSYRTCVVDSDERNCTTSQKRRNTILLESNSPEWTKLLNLMKYFSSPAVLNSSYIAGSISRCCVKSDSSCLSTLGDVSSDISMLLSSASRSSILSSKERFSILPNRLRADETSCFECGESFTFERFLTDRDFSVLSARLVLIGVLPGVVCGLLLASILTDFKNATPRLNVNIF